MRVVVTLDFKAGGAGGVVGFDSSGDTSVAGEVSETGMISNTSDS